MRVGGKTWKCNKQITSCSSKTRRSVLGLIYNGTKIHFNEPLVCVSSTELLIALAMKDNNSRKKVC